MVEKREYITKQRKAILECIKQQGEQFVTIQQIQLYLEQNQMKVGLTTIYRTLDKLVKDKRIARVQIDGVNGTCYRYLLENQKSIFFPMKCEHCGKVVKIDCPELEKLYEHLSREHKLFIDPGKTLFYGVCNHCQSGQ